MAYMQLVRKWGIPVATAAAMPIITPVVCSEHGEKDVLVPTSRMVRPSDLPIYEEPEEVLDFEYHGKERTFLEENVGVVRKEIERVLDATRSVRERAVEIYETGKAHTMATVDYITDEENMLPRAGAITVGGLAGLVIGARKKGGFFKKVLYTSTGIVSAASLCYPRQAYQISQNVYGNAKDYATIGYNFVAGVKPQSKILTQAEPKKVPVASTVQVVAPEPTVEEVPPATSAPTTEPEGAEVRSVMPQVTYHKKLSTPIDTLAQQASDVTLWGFRLIDRSSTGSRSPTELVVPAKPSVPEGFGSVEETNKVAVESTAEVVGKEVCLPENVANIENEKTENSHVEDNVHFVAEKVADFVEEKAAGVVIEAAKEVEKDASIVAATAEVVEELGSKVGPVLNVVKNVSEAAIKAAHYTPGVPEPIIDKVELVTQIVEEAGKVVDNFTSIAESVDEIANEVKREAEEIESQASEVKRSEKKREEIFEKVIDFVKGTESPSSDEVKETSLKLPDIQDKAQLEEIGAEIISEEPAGHLKFTNTDKKDQIQKPKSEIKDTSYLDTEVKGLAPELSGEPKSSSDTEKKIDSRTGGLVIQKEPVVNIEPGSPEKKHTFYKIINFFSKDKDNLVVEKVEDFSVKKVKEPSIDSGMITESDAPLREVTPEAALQSGEANMKVNGSKIFSAPAVTKLSDDEAVPDSIEVLQPVIEGIAKDIAEDVADDALETVSEAVKEAARDVQEAVSDVVEVTDIVEDVGQKIVTVLDTIQEATEDIQKIPGISESVAFKAKVVKEVSEQVETVVEAVTFVAETVEDIAEMLKKEAIEIENQAVELMQSEKKRDELIESIIDYGIGNESSSSGEIKGEFLELPAGDLKIQSSEATTEIIKELPQEANTQEEPEEILAYVAPVEVLEAPKDTVLEPVVKNSLFDQLFNIFSNDEHKDKPAAGGNYVGETRAEPVEEEFNETIIKHDTESNKIEKIKEPSTGNKIVADGKGLIDKLTSPFHNHKGEEITESVMNVKELPSDLPGTEVKEQVIEEVKKSDIYTPTFKEEKKGVFDKLADFLAKGKEGNVLSETMELPAGEEKENVEKLPMDAINETAKDTSAESSLIVKPISSADQPKATNVLQIFSISQDEAASSADTAPEVAVVADTQAAAAAVVPHVDLSEEAQLKLNMKTKKQWPEPVVLEKQPVKTNLPVLAVVKPTMDTLPSGSDKEGLFDKLINFVFKDEEKKAAAAVEDAFEDQGIPVVDGIQSAEKANESSTDTELNEQTVSSKETLNNILSGKQSSAFIKHPENKPSMYKIAEVFSDETEPISVPPEDVAESFNANKSLADVLPDNAPTLKAEDSQIQSNFVIVSSEEDVEETPISDSAIPSLVEVPKLPSESSLSVPSNTEEPVLEVKDKSLFGRLAELVSVDDKKTVLVPTDVTQVKLEPENLSQKEKNNRNTGKPNADSVDILKDSKSSFKNRVANIFTKNKSHKEDSVQSDKKMQVFEQSKTTIVDSDNIFVVKTKPISNVDSGAPGESGQQRNDAAVPVLRGLSRTVESMKQEGKDVVVQLTPPPSPPSQAGIDYGQSNPDDSDMYTTRS